MFSYYRTNFKILNHTNYHNLQSIVQNIARDSWQSLFNSVLDENCPWRENRVKRAVQAPWMASSVLKQLHLKDNCQKTARRSNNADDWSNYRAARNKAVVMIGSAKRKFFCNA